MKLSFALGEINEVDHFEFITRIIGTIADVWHEWADPSPDDKVFAAYFDKHPQYGELALKSFSQAVAYSNSNARTVVITAGVDQADVDTDCYSLNKALDYLAQPLRILVENEVADGHFYLRYIEVVDPTLASLFKEARPSIMFDQGGGNMEVAKLVENRVARAAKSKLRARLAVIADGDSKYPGHQPADTLRLTKVCEDRNVPIHTTRKRSLENYLPDEIFEAVVQLDSNLLISVEFILALGPEQRDHYPIKSGLSEKLSDGERSLYADVPIPASVKPRVSRIEEFFRTKFQRELKLDHLTARRCFEEFRHIAEFIRKEL